MLSQISYITGIKGMSFMTRMLRWRAIRRDRQGRQGGVVALCIRGKLDCTALAVRDDRGPLEED